MAGCLKFYHENFLMGEGNLYNMMKENGYKFSWGINSLIKDFQNRKIVLQTFYNGGRHVRSRLSFFLKAGRRAVRAARSRPIRDQCESA